MCFESVHCIAINRKSYLYKQVETLECYQGWQYGVFAVIVGWIALFPFTLYIGVVKVRAKSISPNEFLVTLFIPPSMIWFLFRSCLRSNPKYYETQSPIDALTSEDDNDIISEVPPQGDYSEESDIIDAERSALLAIVTEPFRINSRHPGLTTTCYHY